MLLIRLLARTLFTAGYLLVLAVFVAGLSARVIPPDVAWWLQPLSILQPYLAAALVVATIAAALMRRWWLTGAGVVGLVFMMLRGGFGAGLLNGTGEGDVTVATFNTGGGIKSVEHYHRDIPALVDRYEPDVLCVQEIWVDSRGDRSRTYRPIHDALDSLGYTFVAPRAAGSSHEVPALISRLPVDSASSHVFPGESPDAPSSAFVRAVVSVGSRKIAVYNVDLRGYEKSLPSGRGRPRSLRRWLGFFRASGTAFIRRAEDARAIRSAFEAEPHPFVVCGDFNSTPNEWVYGILSEGMADAFAAAGGIWGPTFPAEAPRVRIDYVLASKDWRVTSAEVGPNLLPDHRPVIATLRLRGDGEQGR